MTQHYYSFIPINYQVEQHWHTAADSTYINKNTMDIIQNLTSSKIYCAKNTACQNLQ